MNRSLSGSQEPMQAALKSELVKKAVKDLEGEEVLLLYGKGTRRKREIRGTLGKTSREVFLVETEKKGHQITEAFRYTDLIVGNFSMTLLETGDEILPDLGTPIQ